MAKPKTTKDLVHKELMKLYVKQDLTPNNVVRIAADPDNPLHDYIFDCSDQEAAHRHRLTKARGLITWFEVTVIVHKTEFKINEFVHDPYIPKNQQGYVKSLDVKDDAQAALEFLRTELAMSKAYLERSLVFATTLGIDGEVNKILGSVNRILVRISPQ